MKPRTAPSVFYVLFTLSGFSGLIYESIWSHYLKLFLGHAAYAQSLVLATFMGGMALGSWASSRWSGRWPNLLLVYALAEGAVGLLAVGFHGAFVAVTDYAYDTAMPALGSPATVALFKWLLSASLILPQSVLLGMTFPLMAGGMIRLFPQRSGGTIAMLYFSNSIGASAGVLASGFFLIEKVGLPGTILTAGLLNIALAFVVWVLVKTARAPDAAPMPATADRQGGSREFALYLAIALLTGTASFIYEIGWIRMLSMVFGSSTHAFELMLSAFILGLALGGLWVRRRIDGIERPDAYLGAVQIAMGIAALATLAFYDRTFHLMEWLLGALQRSDAGYTVFNLSTHLIALAVMLPASFCAGMTLPLITHCLLRSGSGERAIGAVYAANTVGAIVGVVAAVHVGLPVLGLKGMMVSGATLDIALGLILLWRAFGPRPVVALAVAIGMGAVGLTLTLVRLDPYKMASGVFRHGRLLDSKDAQVVFQGDGKTATVSMVRLGSALSLITNGKADASLNVTGEGPPRGDELAQVLTAALPLAAHPSAASAANIGFGSGTTSHVLLRSSRLQQLDSVEIEPLIIEASRFFQPRNALAYADPRSRIHIEDAKTFFSLHDKRYDIIVSEPSNPWVSGVASLFTEEFYARIRRHLNDGGVFAQWLQGYEINAPLVASILKALGRHFPEYVVYAATDIDFVVLARRGGRIEIDADRLFGQRELSAELARVEIHGPGDLELHRLGSRRALQPYVDSFSMPANSDYFPVLEFGASKARFIGQSVDLALQLAVAPVPALEMLSDGGMHVSPATPATRGWLRKAQHRETARNLVQYLLLERPENYARIPASLRAQARLTVRLLADCAAADASEQAGEMLYAISRLAAPVLRPQELQPLWERVRGSACYRRMLPPEREWIELFAAVSERDPARMSRLAEAILDRQADPAQGRAEYLVTTAVTARLALGEKAKAQALWRLHGDRLDANPSLLVAFLAGHLRAK